jgi:hypothetical protein
MQNRTRIKGYNMILLIIPFQYPTKEMHYQKSGKVRCKYHKTESLCTLSLSVLFVYRRLIQYEGAREISMFFRTSAPLIPAHDP